MYICEYAHSKLHRGPVLGAVDTVKVFRVSRADDACTRCHAAVISRRRASTHARTRVHPCAGARTITVAVGFFFSVKYIFRKSVSPTTMVIIIIIIKYDNNTITNEEKQTYTRRSRCFDMRPLAL